MSDNPQDKMLKSIIVVLTCVVVVFGPSQLYTYCGHDGIANGGNPETLSNLTVTRFIMKELNQECLNFIKNASNLSTLIFQDFQNIQANLPQILANKHKLRRLEIHSTKMSVFDLSVLNGNDVLETLVLDNNELLHRIFNNTSAPIRIVSLQNTPSLKSTKDFVSSTLVNINLNNSGIYCDNINAKSFPSLKKCIGKYFKEEEGTLPTDLLKESNQENVDDRTWIIYPVSIICIIILLVGVVLAIKHVPTQKTENNQPEEVAIIVGDDPTMD